MKKFIYAFLAIGGLLSLSACSEDSLITTPTDALDYETMMSDPDHAMVAIDGIYRSMYTPGWSTDFNTHQCFGISAYTMAAEIMGDDHIMGASGSGWFWYDAAYNVKGRFTSAGWRSYDLWNGHYKWIANANYVIDAMEKYVANENDALTKNYVLGQAYAIRGYSYFMLAQWFARTYKGHESDPCVPLYTKPTYKGTTGEPRATVAAVYDQINKDLNRAVELLKGIPQQGPTNMSYDVAQGIRARVALVEEDWATAEKAAEEAIAFSGKQIISPKDFEGNNDVKKDNVMWGAQIIGPQASGYASLYAHWDTCASYGYRAPKLISNSLYNKMSDTDTRKAIWFPVMPEGSFAEGKHLQRKLVFSDPSQWLGDYIWMRVEEMYLIAAEAECRLSKEGEAKDHLMALMAKRDPSYTCDKTGTALGKLTSDETGSLLEEIILQRRIELWGEAGRVFDIKRLKQGFIRKSEDGWPGGLLLKGRPTDDPENYMWVLTIPQAEFDGNKNMTLEKDQNPVGDK
ncbi:MAG: RagB/SusD family nutrient uptake outer membrane protein [Muribaculaceae bacterium]|nr:RagB/SusD family nutrient uptake outer membrane protein [Muribaculaceae bacterium]